MGTKPSEIYELSKITKMAVFYSEDNIAFVIRIPLITELELFLYKIIPIPHPIKTIMNGICCVLDRGIENSVNAYVQNND